MSVPSYLEQRYPQLALAVPPTTRVIDRLPMSVDAETSGHFEFEGRLGRLVPGENGRERFVPGVSRAFMDKTLAKVSAYPGWESVTAWVESQDCYYELPPATDDLNERGILVRTTTEFSDDGDPAVSCRRVHISKNTIDSRDFRFKVCGPMAADKRYDLRVALSFEENVPEKDLPDTVPEPNFVRIKTRKSFLYKPNGASRPLWNMDFTQSWGGKTYEEAERKQRSENPEDTQYEIEVECRDPYEYLQNQNQDQFTLALSLLMKMEDFVGKGLPFQWVPARRFS